MLVKPVSPFFSRFPVLSRLALTSLSRFPVFGPAGPSSFSRFPVFGPAEPSPFSRFPVFRIEQKTRDGSQKKWEARRWVAGRGTRVVWRSESAKECACILARLELYPCEIPTPKKGRAKPGEGQVRRARTAAAFAS